MLLISFCKNGEVVRAVNGDYDLPGLRVGQLIAFDHPTTSECLGGRVTNIQHVVYLGEENSLTYIDVEVTRSLAPAARGTGASTERR